MLATELKKQCRILAIEPDAENFARLLKHVQWNALGNVVQCYELGVSDCEGTAAMKKPAGNSGHARISNVETGSSFVTLTTLDAFCAARGLDRLDAILLDVEGYEAAPAGRCEDVGPLSADGRR